MSHAEEVVEADEDKKFRIDYDLNTLHLRLQDCDPADEIQPIGRAELALNDAPKLRMVLRQLKQMLGMI